MTGSDGEMPPTEVLRRLVGESDEEYLARLVEARARVVNARLSALEAKMLTVLDGFHDVKERQDKQEERHERTIREFFESEGRILKAISDYKTAQHESCRAVGAMAADVVRAWGSSVPLVTLTGLALIVYAAWLLDLVPRVETGMGTVEFTPTQPAPSPQPPPQ